MIERLWYMERVAKAMNTFQQGLAMAVSRGADLRDSQYRARLEGVSNKLRDELKWALDNDGVEDFTPRMQSFVDEILDFWVKMIDFKEFDTDIVLVVRAPVIRKPAQDAKGQVGTAEEEDPDPTD